MADSASRAPWGCSAHDVRRVAERAGHELILVDLPELDIINERAVLAFYERERPEATINCAAWTDVEAAESNREAAHAVNADGAGNLARAAAGIGTPLLHISTDYVFDGVAPLDAKASPAPIVESDPTGPRSVYGESKLAGERQVLDASPDHTVVRTAWLYGIDGRELRRHDAAFGRRARRGAGGGRSGRLADMVGTPCASGAGAARTGRQRACAPHRCGFGVVERLCQGDFPSGRDGLSRRGGSSAEMARPAPRPAFSVLETEREDVLPMARVARRRLAGYLAAHATARS